MAAWGPRSVTFTEGWLGAPVSHEQEWPVKWELVEWPGAVGHLARDDLLGKPRPCQWLWTWEGAREQMHVRLHNQCSQLLPVWLAWEDPRRTHPQKATSKSKHRVIS